MRGALRACSVVRQFRTGTSVANSGVMQSSSFVFTTTLFFMTSAAVAGCVGSDSEPTSGEDEESSALDSPPGSSKLPSVSSSMGGGGGTPSGPNCLPDSGVRQTYLCAGDAKEDTLVSRRSVRLVPQTAEAACLEAGVGLLYPDEPPGFGGQGGALGMGGGPGDPDLRAFCQDIPASWFIGGLSFSVGACGESELALPLRFVEPFEWYRLRIYVSDSPCDRGKLVAEQAGYGIGDVVELELGELLPGFITLELTDEGVHYQNYYGYPSYYSASSIEIELDNLRGPQDG